MEKHEPVQLTANERIELGSITKHPGLTVVIEKIMKGHCDIQLGKIMKVQVDDPNRLVKLNAIAECAFAMQLFLECVQQEIARNWEILRAQEEKSRKDGESQ